MNSSILVLIFSQLLFVHLTWYLSIKYQKGDFVDLTWVLLIFSIVSFNFFNNSITSRSTIIYSLVFIWAIRLGSLIFVNRILRPKEDNRYSSFRKKWGSDANRNFYLLFLFQILIAWPLTIPFFYAFSEPNFSTYDYLGLLLFFIAYQGVVLADNQLQAFKRLPEKAKEVCDFGLWKYSRHPNYFFESIIWFSYLFFTVKAHGLVFSMISPVLMLILLLFVTGVPPSEKQSLQSRGDKYRQYQKRTSKFFPLPSSKN